MLMLTERSRTKVSYHADVELVHAAPTLGIYTAIKVHSLSSCHSLLFPLFAFRDPDVAGATAVGGHWWDPIYPVRRTGPGFSRRRRGL